MGRREYEALVITGIIVVSTILGNMVLPSLTGAAGYLYYFKPLFWLALSGYVWIRPRCRFNGKLKLYKFIIIWSAICSIVYVSLYFFSGFIDGIGKSPYNKSFSGILVNFICFGGVLAMMEWVRNYIINRVKKRYIVLFSVIVIFTFSIYKLNLRLISGIETWQQAVRYLGEYAIPEVMCNVFLTYMVYIGGACPSIIYVIITNLPVWIMPVLPNIRWITKAFIGIMLPVAFILVIRQVYKKQTKEIKIRQKKVENPYAWVGVSVFSIAIIWFAVGVFPIFPTVILTGSMEPVIYPGDVAIMQKCDGKNIKVGDVIQYWTGKYFIIHRVISIEEETGKYKTKGDNNSAPDSALVAEGQIKGRMLKVVPKLGILATYFKSNNEVKIEDVKF